MYALQRQVHKVVSLPAHKVFEGDEIVDSNPITAMTWNHDGTLLVSGDSSGLINYCDETFREVRKIPDAHSKPVRGLSFSPLDFKLVSCRQVILSCSIRFHNIPRPHLLLMGQCIQRISFTQLTSIYK